MELTLGMDRGHKNNEKSLCVLFDIVSKLYPQIIPGYWNTKMTITLKQRQIEHMFIWTFFIVFISLIHSWSGSHILRYILYYIMLFNYYIIQDIIQIVVMLYI